MEQVSVTVIRRFHPKAAAHNPEWIIEKVRYMKRRPWVIEIVMECSWPACKGRRTLILDLRKQLLSGSDEEPEMADSETLV